MDVPCFKLDRDPYQGVSGDFRIRKHGLLKLGHSRYQHIVDGTLCIDRSDPRSALLHDRDAIFRSLSAHNMPIAAQDTQFRNCTTPGRAARSAATIGYPVVVKPLMRSQGKGISLNIPDAGSLPAAVRKAQEFGRGVIVEKLVPGETFKLVVAGGKLTGAVSAATGVDVTDLLHPDFSQIADTLGSSLNFGLLVVTVVTTDINKPLAETGGKIVDLEVAPELDAFLPPGTALIDRAAEQFVRWIYPEGSKSRVPIISITGTNGKTTTTRMVTCILQEAGYHTGMATTDGVYINNPLTEKGDLAGVTGHLRVLESNDVDCAVLETARGALLKRGVVFDWCDIALCTNVSQDHLGEMGIESLQQMAELKRGVLERARRVAVLNADDEHCRAMLPHLSAKTICLTTMRLGITQLRNSYPEADCFGVLEQTGEDEYIVIYDSENRYAVIATKEIPAAYDAKLRINVNNALNAAVVCHLMQIDLAHIRTALKSFAMSYQNTPNRFNIYDSLPFTILVDYAHNEEGVRTLSEFVQSLDMSGRRILCYAVDDARSDDHIRATAAAAAGSFDLYICKNYERTSDYINVHEREDLEVPTIMKQGLVGAGVAECQIVLINDEKEAFTYALNMAEPGDYVVLLVGNAAKNFTREFVQDYIAAQPPTAKD
jgi:cyanophycin synthetase